ncbi:hypothetical protein, partial [Bradyrhizobium sp.]|uniref:hypothetical protein n=1 Tax=Bradyrhizobium sp. TaxID=376 RepID=UPI003C57D35F
MDINQFSASRRHAWKLYLFFRLYYLLGELRHRRVLTKVSEEMDAILRLVKWYGSALFVVGLLILFPVTGFFLTILTQGRLLSLILNLFMLHIGYLACTRKISLAWLVVPVGFYGAWIGWVNSKSEAVYLEKSKLESENRITGQFEKSNTLVFPDEDS